MKSLIPWRQRTMGALESWRDEMEGLFQRFFGEPSGGNGPGARPWVPRVDIEETDKEVLIRADVPGIDAKGVEVAVAEGVLTIKGERKEERKEEKKNYHQIERFVGRFYREIPLPANVDADKITATSAKGVVTITIPKKPEAQTKKIAVQAQD